MNIIPPDQLDPFKSIDIASMDKVELLDRIDTKYLFHFSKLPLIIEQIRSCYFLMEINGCRCFDYESLYFDTPEFSLYNLHHNGRLNRYKVRYRKYVQSNLFFFEIKFKDNKGRTHKKRIKQNSIYQIISGPAREFLMQNSNLDPFILRPSLWVFYSRLTFVNHALNERLTLDINLNYGRNGISTGFENLVIAELKQGGFKGSSFFPHLMRKLKIYPNSISKYSIGISRLVDGIRKNNFKPKLLILNKILYANF